MTLDDIKARCGYCPDCDTHWKFMGTPAATGHRCAIQINGKRYPVRRTVFELHKGRAVRKGYCVLSDCTGERCMNPELLVEVSKSGVVKRQIAQGILLNAGHKAKLILARQARESKLGPEKAMEIYLCEEKHEVIAAKYGVSRQAVSEIKNQRSYRQIHANPFQGLMR